MNCPDFYPRILIPAAEFAASIHAPLDSPGARLQMLATAGYESAWTYRAQEPQAVALGFWMNQQNAVQLLVDHAAAGPVLRAAAEALCIPVAAVAIHSISRWNDSIAYLIARLLAWCDPHPVPAIGDEEACWQAYLRAQNPGSRDRQRWAEVYPQAVACVSRNAARETQGGLSISGETQPVPAGADMKES